MVFRITGGVTIDGGLTSSGREPDPPSPVTATKINDSTVRLTVTDPINTGGLPITTYTALTYITTPLSGTVSDLQEAVYTTPGTYTWTAPAGVTSVCVVCVGGGGGGGGADGSAGGGGGLGYKNNISVTPGSGYTVVVGAAGAGGPGGGVGQDVNTGANGGNGGDSYFINTTTVRGIGGSGGIGGLGGTGGTATGGAGGGYVGDGGGNGGNGGNGNYGSGFIGGIAGSGGGAGGYSGNGGRGGDGSNTDTLGTAAGAGSGGGGGGGGAAAHIFGNGNGTNAGAGGGGVGLLGQDNNGYAGASVVGSGQFGVGAGGIGGGGSGGSAGGAQITTFAEGQIGGSGGGYGGGGGGGAGRYNGSPTVQNTYGGNGGGGAVRIIWGTNVSFPFNAKSSANYNLVSSTTSSNNIINAVNNYNGGDGPVEYIFDGATFYEIPYHNAFELADNGFAIEAFITPTTTNVMMGIVNNWYIGGAFNWYINENNTLTFTYHSNGENITYTGSTVIQPNVRTHIVIQKVGANMQFFINGVADPVTYTGNFNYRFIQFYENQKKPLRYGIGSDGTGYFTGKISNLRISKKQYLYGSGTNSSFPVPSLPLEITQSVVSSGGRDVIASLVPSEVLLLALSDPTPGKDKSNYDWSSALSGTIGIVGKVEYAFKVSATNAAGTSTLSAASNIIRYLGPNAPTIGTATRVENTSASVTFNAPADSGDGPVLDYIAVSSPGGFNTIGTSSPITVSGLVKGTNYTFTVSARNKFATGTASAASNSVTAIGIPDAPTVGTATFASGSSATVSFTPTNNGGLPVTYTVKSYPEGKTASGSGTSLTVTGLTTGQTYNFTVTATNSLGTSPESSASNSLAFIVPNAPTVGLATMTGKTTARLEFTAPTNNGGPAITGYTVVSTPGGITATGTSSPINITGLTFGTIYTLRVYATNLIGNSSNSSESNEVVYTGPGQVLFSTLGTTNWVVPAGVTLISAVAVGGGAAGSTRNNLYEGNGGGGGGLSWSNDIAVTPGETLTVFVGNGGQTSGAAGQNSTISRGGTTLLLGDAAYGTAPGRGGNETAIIGQGGSMGGSGGLGGEHQGTQLSGGGGGGGAGGYDSSQRYSYQASATGSGADFVVSFINTNKGEWGNGTDAPNGSGAGGGGAAGSGNLGLVSGRGGGVGVNGLGADGTAGLRSSSATTASGKDGSGGSYGYGGYGGDPMRRSNSSTDTFGKGGQGAVRIIWAGASGLTRQFPNTNTGDIIYVDYVVVAGGGGGGIGAANYTSSGGGGGAGGMLSGNDVLLKTGVTYTITVGAGGSGGIASTTSGSSLTAPNNGGASSISGSGLTTISAVGGGRGGSSNVFGSGSGGSGGGGSSSSTSTIAAGSGTAGQGNNGGSVLGSSTGSLAGGGGGASASGQSGNTGGSGRAGNGGDGLLNPFPEGPTYLAGGGGGSGTNTSGQFLVGGGGLGGGGSGYFGNFNVGSTSYPGTSGTGGGGGGLSGGGGSQYITNDAGNGGSGVVMLRIEASVTPTTVTGSPIITTVGNYKYYRWNGNGSIKF